MTAYYIDQNGSDSNNGTGSGTAWRCIQRALDELGDGDILNVAGDNWMFEHITKEAGTGDFGGPGNIRFTLIGATFETDGVANGDYLWATDPDGTYRSYKIEDVESETLLTLYEGASAGAAAGAAGCWVTQGSNTMPQETLTCTASASNSETAIKITFNGTNFDFNGLDVFRGLYLYDCDNIWILGDLTIHGMASARKGLEIVGSGGGNSKNVVIDGVTVYDGAYGIYINYAVSGILVANCECYGCGTYGLYFDAVYSGWIYNCRIHDNTGAGIWIDDGEILVDGCLVYGNGTYGMYLDGSNGYGIQNCVIYDNGTYGIWYGTWLVTNNFRTNPLINNIIWGNDTRDIHCDSTETPIGFQRNNYFYTKSDPIDVDDTDIQSPNDPGFLDAANGDFRLKAASPCIKQGFSNRFIVDDERNIGPHQPGLRLPGARPAAYANPLGAL